MKKLKFTEVKPDPAIRLDLGAGKGAQTPDGFIPVDKHAFTGIKVVDLTKRWPWKASICMPSEPKAKRKWPAWIGKVPLTASAPHRTGPKTTRCKPAITSKRRSWTPACGKPKRWCARCRPSAEPTQALVGVRAILEVHQPAPKTKAMATR